MGQEPEQLLLDGDGGDGAYTSRIGEWILM